MLYDKLLEDRRAIITGNNDISRETARVFREHGAQVVESDDVLSAIEEMRGADILVHAGGVYTPGDINTLTEETFMHAVNATFTKAILDTRTVLPHMLSARRGDLVFIVSDLATASVENALAISTCASALNAFSRSLSMDYVRYRVQADCILYPFDASPQRKPLLGAPEPIDAAHAALFFCSRFSRFIIAETLPVNGGINYFSEGTYAIR